MSAPMRWYRLVVPVFLVVLVGACAARARLVRDRVRVPGGTLVAGLDDAARARVLGICRATMPTPDACTARILHDEERRVSVHVDGFAIDRLEVSQRRYRACVAAGGCTAPITATCVYGNGQAPPPAELAGLGADELPVVCVTFAQSAAFCAWAGGRLPDEAEWERAARGADGRIFPWGDDWRPRVLNWGDDGSTDGYALTAPVGSYPAGASPTGALDMVGNAWEWTRRVAALDERAGDGRQIIRGAGFAAVPHAQRVTKRVPYDPRRAYPNVGFRCAYHAGRE